MRDLRGAPNSWPSRFGLVGYPRHNSRIFCMDNSTIFASIHYSVGFTQRAALPLDNGKKFLPPVRTRTQTASSGSAADGGNPRGCRGRRHRDSGGGATGRLVTPFAPPAAGLAVLPHLYRSGPKLGAVQLLDRRLGFLLFQKKIKRTSVSSQVKWSLSPPQRFVSRGSMVG